MQPNNPAEEIIELGFHLLPKFWGQGLATEAARAVIPYAFEKYAAKKLVAGHHPENVNSKKVLDKLGFKYSHDERLPGFGRGHSAVSAGRTERRKEVAECRVDWSRCTAYRIFWPRAERTSSTPSRAVRLCSSRMGLISTTSRVTMDSLSAIISMAKWASR